MKYILSIVLLFATYTSADSVIDVNSSRIIQKTLKEGNVSVVVDSNKTLKTSKTDIDTPQSIALKREKLNILIRQFNRFSMGVYKVYPYYERYFGTNPDNYKKARSGYVLEIFQKLDKSAFERAKKIDILHELDVLINDYYTSAKHVKKLSNEAYEYYNMKDYKNDKYAKGKQMHTPLLEAYNAFFKADEVLKGEVETIQDALDVQYFKALKEQGHMFAYIKGMSLLESKKFLKSISNKKIKEINFTTINTRLNKIRGYYDMLKEMRDKDEEAYDSIDMSSAFFNALKYYTIAAKDLTFRVKEKRAYTKKEKRELSGNAAWMVRSSVGDVSSKYNKLVEAYNSH